MPRPLPRAYFTIAPDLAVEVTSPGDTESEVVDKVGDWLAAGTSLIWTVNPWVRSAQVYRADGTSDMIPATGTLSGEDVLPGLSIDFGAMLS